jgi:hypothetical protein
MPVPVELVNDLLKKIRQDRLILPNLIPPGDGPTVNLGELEPKVTALNAADMAELKGKASTSYDQITKFIRDMNPYGKDVIAFPPLPIDGAFDLTNISELREKTGIKVAGWLRKNYSDQAELSSDMEMTLAQKNQSFYWDFRYPEDPTDAEPNGGEMMNLQITKAVRIPFVYRRDDGKLLLGHIVIGYEGAGSM